MHIELNVRSFLERAAAAYPDRVAVVDEPDQAHPWGPLTFADLLARARAQAAGLDRLGVGPGERVAIVSHNAARLLTSFFGVPGWGRILVPVNFRLARADVAYILEHSGASVVLVDPELEDALAGLGPRHRFVLGRDTDPELFGDDDAEPGPWAADETATATVNYTSGTTARPKGVQLTHRNCWMNATVFGWHVGVGDRDVYLHTLPMFHANGWGMPWATAAMGVPQIVLRKIDGTEILRRVEAHGVTLLCAAPAVVNAVLDAAGSWDGPVPGRGTTRVVVAGAPPPSRTIERVESELGWEFLQIYGLTETAPLLTVNRVRPEWDGLPADERARRLMRAGAPSVGTELTVSGSGEVLVRSNTVMDGYWDQPAETEAALADGWFHTGDGGRLDDEGHLAILDRKKDVIITGGENVSSIEVEDAIFSLDGVAEVAVIGVPDDTWGEMVLALVVPEPGSGLTDGDVLAHCRDNLAHFKCPKRIELRDELPRTATGKLQKFRLRAPYWEGRDRQVN